MHCILPFLCWATLAPAQPAAVGGPYSDVGLRANGRHIGDIGGKPYVAHEASFMVEGALGQRYPVYLYPAAR